MDYAEIELEDVASTNTWVKQNIVSLRSHMPVLVYAHRQAAGRGQRGNSWESEPDKNLTLSLLFDSSSVPPSEQFLLSESVSLGVSDYLTATLGAERGAAVSVKWPNDIYVGDSKICGILLEHSITGCHHDYTIAGIGLNVNQDVFVSDAPNPVSLVQIDNRERNLDVERRQLAKCVLNRLERMVQSNNAAETHQEYKSRLWRREGLHAWRATATGREFMASIADVASSGILRLRESDGECRDYWFKEVHALLSCGVWR